VSTDLMPLFLGFCLRASLVLALAWALTIAMRRASASARHFLWTCAIAAAALVPVTALAVPDWRVPAPAALTALASRLAPGAGTPASQSVAPRADTERPPADPSAIARNATAEPSATRITAPSGAGTLRLRSGQVVLTVWAIGSAVVLLYLLIGLAGAGWMRRRAVRANVLLIEDTDALAEALEVPRPIPVVESATLTMPMVCGLWRPLIVMPIDAAQWPEERRRVVLLHELAHIKRRDCLTQALAQLVCAAYWFNPLVWIAARQLRTERERACDDFVLAAGTRGSAYAAHLLDIAQAMRPARFSPVAVTSLAMARRTQLEGRLMAILDPAIRRSSALYTRFAAATLVALISIPVAAVQLASPKPADGGGPAATRDVADVALSTTTQPAGSITAAPVPTAQAPARGAAQAPVKPTTDDRLRFTLNRTLIEFADEGDVEGVAAMLAAGADVNAAIEGDGSPLINAADEGQLEIVRLLLDKGADPNLIVPGDGSALIAAASEGHLDIVRLLLDKGANPNLTAPDSDGSPLIAAAGDGHVDVLELLLQRGAQVNLVVEGDETALIQAAGDGHLDAVKLLVSKGADVNLGVPVETVRWDRASRFPDSRDLRQTEWRTPLSEARGDRHLAVVTFLISAGARD
jgi:beta-lactamase regulating signal transducer with metallopeptidase domain